ncbi:rod-binding protein [bacterium]|nr:rod-binding protein [bacterium]
MISTLMPASGYLHADKAGDTKTREEQWNEMKQSAKDFEAYFVGSIFQSAYQSIEKSDLFEGGSANELYQSLFIEEMTKAGANSPRGFGLADAMLKQVSGRYGMTEADIAPKETQVTEKTKEL